MIFVVEDEPVLCRSIVEFLRAVGHEVEGFGDAERALDAAKAAAPDLVVSDIQLPGMSGLELLEALAQLDPGMVRIAMTAHGSVDSAVRAMRSGCWEYFEKPVDLEQLQRAAERALGTRRSARELAWVRGRVDELVGESAAIRALDRHLEQLARLGAEAPPVLITGETGVGKGLIARALHARRFGERAPLIEVNCSALPATLIEAELFGHERAAFTDAKEAKPGLFEAAAGGTLFLDEIGEMPLELQAKLLTVVESGLVRRVGALRPRKVSAAIVAASNVDLEQAARERRFRSDLYHRLAAFTLHVPPLRERKEDIAPLARAFLARFATKYGKRVAPLSREALARLEAHAWPGNVRELSFAIERALIQSEDGELRPELSRAGAPPMATVAASASGVRVELPDAGIAFDELERAILEAALAKTDGKRGPRRGAPRAQAGRGAIPHEAARRG